MPIENSLSFKGLVTSPNNLGAGSEGALVVADNVTIRYPDVLEPRRGQESVTVGGLVSPAFMQATYTGTQYSVETQTPHGYSNGQTIYVSQGGVESAYETTVTTVTSPTQFVVVSAQWPNEFPLPAPFVSSYFETWNTTALVAFPVSQVSFFQDETLLHSAALEKLKFVGAATALTGDYLAADPDYRLKTAVASQTLYMATDKGVMALEDAASTVPRLSGIAEPLKPVTAVVVDPTSPTPFIPGFLDPEKAVAYRILFGYVDSHGATHLGPPSVKFTVKNASTTTQASVRLLIPLLTVPTDVAGNIIEGTFVRLYRSVMAATEGATSDELYLVNETVIDPATYTTTSLDFEIADTARQEFAVQSAPLYTNATQGGLPNDPPPFARDLATWSEREWYANTEQPFSLTAQLIGVEGGGNPDIPATGIRAGDTLTIDGVVFTADASTTSAAARLFRVYTSGGADQNISETLNNLATAVNGYAILTPAFQIRAYLEPVVFGNDQRNFKIRFQRPSVDSTVNATFSVVYTPLKSVAAVTGSAGAYTITTTGNHGLKVGDFVLMSRQPPSSLFPSQTIQVEAPVTPTTFASSSVSGTLPQMNRVQRLYGESVWTPDLSAGVAADNERLENGLYYSNLQEPEAVSASSYLLIGTRGKAIRRIVPQRDRLLVFKDEGTYAVYGDFPYQVQLVDDTVAILAPDSAVAIGSTVIVLTEDGIMAVADGGIQMISKVIDSTLKPYLAAPYRATTRTAFGVAYESEKVFALFMPSLGITGYTAKAYVFGMESTAWTTWSFSEARTCGRVDPFSDTAYYGVEADPYLFKDKNTSSTADYCDSTGPIVSTVQWASTTLGAPYATKQAREIHFHYRDVRKPNTQLETTALAEYTLKTDIVPAGQSFFAWNPAASFSTASIIGPAVLPLQYRKLIPQDVQRATYYTLCLNAQTDALGGYWALNGYSIVYEGTSERTGTVR